MYSMFEFIFVGSGTYFGYINNSISITKIDIKQYHLLYKGMCMTTLYPKHKVLVVTIQLTYLILSVIYTHYNKELIKIKLNFYFPIHHKYLIDK